MAALVTQRANDKQQLKPMLKKLGANCGRLPEKVSADAGYFNSKQLTDKALGSVLKTSALPSAAQAGSGVVGQMREKLRTTAGQAVYQWRKAIVEAVFGQIKEARGFSRFAFRGLAEVGAEWELICLTYNLLKLWQAKLRVFTG